MTLQIEGRSFFLESPDTPAPVPWRWRNFRYEEVACRDGTGLLLNTTAMDCLQTLRNLIAAPIIVHSGYRSIWYNKTVGGALQSFHLSGAAFDIRSAAVDLDTLAAQAVIAGFTGIGRYETFIHVDIGPYRRWQA